MAATTKKYYTPSQFAAGQVLFTLDSTLKSEQFSAQDIK